MYLSQSQVVKSLKDIESVHPFFGISFLACKKSNLPVGQVIDFPINQNEENFLKKYYQPDPDSDYFFRSFRVSEKKKYWLRPDYPSSGSQKSRTTTFKQAFIHDSGTAIWGWEKNYLNILQKHFRKRHWQPLPAFALAVWLFREKKWPLDTTPQKIIEMFLRKFNITEEEQTAVFDISIPEGANNEEFLIKTPFSWQKLVEELNIPLPPDAPKDEGGTLSVLTIEEVGPAKKLHLELAERVNLFTGDNGLGKTFILECAWWALSGNWTSFPAYPRKDVIHSLEDICQEGRRIFFILFAWLI